MKGRPNILMLVMDQFRYDLFLRKDIKTPYLDTLAEEGVSFQDAFTPCVLCSPARASILTGKYPHNHGILNNVHEEDALRQDLPDQPTLNTILKKQGYYQAYYGKWHVARRKSPLHFGFDEGVVIDSNHPPEGVQYLYRPPINLPIHGDPPYGTLRGGVEGTDTYEIAQLGIDFLQRQSGEGRPFFLRLDWPGPHFPHIIPESYATIYKGEDMDLDANFYDNLRDKPQIQKILREKYAPITSLTREGWQELRAYYYGYVTMLDHQLGRVLKNLEKEGYSQQTIILFTSDHGDMTGAHRLFNKGALAYEEVIRVPLIIKVPGGFSGIKVGGGVLNLDLMPTLLEAVGIEAPKGDGISLWPLLLGEDQYLRDEVYMEFHGDELGLYSQRILRTERYKFIYNGPDINELYDLQIDPFEMVNLVDDPLYRELKEDLKERLVEKMKAHDDPLTRWISTVL